MLRRLGFLRFAYDWRAPDVPLFERQVVALKQAGVALHAWWFPFNAADPIGRQILDVCRRQEIRPQLWLRQLWPPFPPLSLTPRDLPEGFPLELGLKEPGRLSVEQRTVLQKAITRSRFRQLPPEVWPQSPQDQARRVEQEALRVGEIAVLAARQGMEVALYNHGGWFGTMENQLQMIDHLRRRGVDNVSLAYNFSHARDEWHDDSKDFAKLWGLIRPHVTTVNVSGIHMDDGTALLPTEGDRAAAAAMMQIIEASGWSGPVGVTAESGGDNEVTLASALKGMEQLAAEIRHTGSAPGRTRSHQNSISR